MEATRIGKWLVVEDVSERWPRRKTKTWWLLNNASQHLGRIEWAAEWRQYVWISPLDDVVMSAGCLEDLARFLRSVRDERRRGVLRGEETRE